MQLLPRDRLKSFLFRPLNRKGILPVVFERRPRVFAFLNFYLLVILLGYFGIISTASWLGLNWPHIWISWWSPLADLLASFIPAFDNIERGLVGTDYGDRVGVIHHLLALGWLTTGAVVLVVTVLAFGALSDWRRLASLHSRWWFASVGLLSLFSLFVTAFVLGVAPQYRAGLWLGAWHRSELQLMILALCFYAMIAIAVGTILAFGALLLSWSNDDVPET
jgi:hypothetical protein